MARRRRKTITLKYAGKCADCGAALAVGSTARWYGRGRVYGMDCHEDTRHATPAQHADDFPPTNVQLLPDDEEGAQLENRPSDDPNEAIRFEVEVPGLGVKMRTIPQTKLFD